MGNSFESQARGYNDEEVQIIKGVEFGSIPENPSDVSEKDIKALVSYYAHHPDKFPSGKYIDVRDWDSWRDISCEYNGDDENGKWYISYKSLFTDAEVVKEFDSLEKAQSELDKLKNYNKEIALALIREARNFAIGEDLDAPWPDSIDVSATTVIEPKTKSIQANESEIRQDGFEFKSAGKKYINQNYKRICLALGIEGESLGIIKRQANQEKQLPDIQGELSLEQVNFYRQHYGFDSLSQDEYESMKSEKQPEPEVLPEPEIEGREDKKLTRADFGDIPEDPYNIKNNDLEALNSLFDAKRDAFPNSQYVDIRNWAEWTPIEVVAPEKPNGKWLITKGVNHELVGDFDSETQANTEFDRIKNEDKQKALDLLKKARNFAIGEALDAPWESEPEDYPDLIESQPENQSMVEELKLSDEDSNEDQAEGLDNTVEVAIEGQDSIDTDTKDTISESVDVTQQESIEDNNFEALQQELDRLIELEAQKLQGEKTTENGSYQIDREKLERFKEESKQAIANYQKFASEHSSPIEKSNPQIQERYQLIEKEAWNSLRNLAHLLDGEIATLPQDRDIQLSHPEGVDIRQYLEERGYKFDENGDITHITDNGVEIELNRAMKTDGLIKSQRPSHIVYDKSISLDNDINYQGYLVRGLNQQTPDFIVGVLDKNNLENVIVDETNQETVENETSPTNLNPESATDKTDEFDIVEDTEDAADDLVDRLAQLREQYAEAEEIYNRHRNDPEAAKLFNDSRAEYNEALERMLKLKVAEGQEANIHQIFKDEVMSLRDSRIEQSQELQGEWEKRFNGAKEKFLGWATKNKRNWMIANIGLFAAGALLSSTGAGIPVSGALEMTRRSLGSVMSGVGSRNTLVGLMEDRDININTGFIKIKFQAVVPKIVRESISESEEQIKQVSDEVLKDRLGTLEAYYRLNGGKFTDNQQKAYEKVLTELGHRVRRNTLENYYKDQETSPNLENNEAIESNTDNPNEPNNQDEQDSQFSEIVHSAKFNFAEVGQSSRYASELLNTISDKRITELDKFRKNRKIATLAGVGVTAIGTGFLLNHMAQHGGLFNPNVEPGAPSQISPDQTTGPGINPEVTPPSAPEIPSTGAGEALSQATAEQAQELARDVSSLSSGETIWGEIAKQLGPNASPDQIQHALENYLESGVGQNTMFELAEKTEGGRALLAQWGIDNVGEMASLSKGQLYEISKHLGAGQLEGISNFNIDHLEAFQPAEYIDSATPDAVNTIPDTTNTPPVVETPIAPPAPEVPPVAANEFTSQLSEALGTSNLTETQLQEAIHSFATSEQGSVELYNQIISNEEGARFLSGFGVNNAAYFANLRPDELYEIAQTVGVENLDKLPGFELNEIILSKFEDAPDMVELARGTRPLDVVNRYIASEVGNLPYDSTLGQQVLNTYLDTTDGKQWLYDAIVNNPDVDNQNIQLFREYLRFKDIKSPEDFVAKFNWSEFSGNKNIPTAAFWNQTRLPNGGARLQPLSTFLKPSQMTGIKEAVRQVLTR